MNKNQKKRNPKRIKIDFSCVIGTHLALNKSSTVQSHTEISVVPADR